MRSWRLSPGGSVWNAWTMRSRGMNADEQLLEDQLVVAVARIAGHLGGNGDRVRVFGS